MKVLLKGPFSSSIGYGNDMIAMVKCLINWGADVRVQPTYCEPPLPMEILTTFTKSMTGPFDLIIAHITPMDIAASSNMKNSADCVVGWTMWEFSNFDLMTPHVETLKKRLEKFDVVFAYDQVCADALKPFYENTKVLQGGFDPEKWTWAPRDWDSEVFRFCMLGALNFRKSPMVAINAFKELKDSEPDFEKCELHLKTSLPGQSLHPMMEKWCPGLYLYQDIWSLDQIKEFYSRMHVLLAPSRGEGKNLPALEFMSTGGTVIGTNWGGHVQWMSSEYAYPLNYTLTAHDPVFSDCLSAEPDKDHLKELMLNVVRNRGEAKRKAEIASRIIPKMCSWENVFDRLFRKLEDSGYSGIRNKALMCRISDEERFAASQGRINR